MVLIPYRLVFPVWAWQVTGSFSVKLLNTFGRFCCGFVLSNPALGASVVFVLMTISSGSGVLGSGQALYRCVLCAPGQVTVCTWWGTAAGPPTGTRCGNRTACSPTSTETSSTSSASRNSGKTTSMCQTVFESETSHWPACQSTGILWKSHLKDAGMSKVLVQRLGNSQPGACAPHLHSGNIWGWRFKQRIRDRNWWIFSVLEQAVVAVTAVRQFSAVLWPIRVCCAHGNHAGSVCPHCRWEVEYGTLVWLCCSSQPSAREGTQNEAEGIKRVVSWADLCFCPLCTLREERFAFGHHYFRPHETHHSPSRKFYHNELFRVPLYEIIPLEAVVGTCCVLDLYTYCKGEN